MKTLKNYISESILDDIDVGLSKTAEEVMYPIPSIKDFQKSGFGGQYVTWECNDIIQQYINMLYMPDYPPKFKRDFNAILIVINKYKEVLVWLKNTKTESSYGLKLGNYANDGVVKEKKYIIELFRLLLEDTKRFEKFFELHNNACKYLEKNGYCEMLDISDIIKKIK